MYQKNIFYLFFIQTLKNLLVTEDKALNTSHMKKVESVADMNIMVVVGVEDMQLVVVGVEDMQLVVVEVEDMQLVVVEVENVQLVVVEVENMQLLVEVEVENVQLVVVEVELEEDM